MATLPPLSMPHGSTFSALFPPILDLQTREAITGRSTAEHAGIAPPSFTVPELETPVPSFLLRDIDGDGDESERGRLINALERRESGKTVEPPKPESFVFPQPLGSDYKSVHDTPSVDNIWERAAQESSESSLSGFELHSWEAPTTPSPFKLPPAPVLAFDGLTIQPEPLIELPRLTTPLAVPPTDAVGLLDHLVRTTMMAPPPGLRWSRSKARFVYDSKRGERSAAGFTDEILAIATAMRRLEIVVNEDSSLLTPTHRALLCAIATMLAYMRQRLSDMEGTSDASSWLSRDHALEDVARLSRVLCDVICWPLAEVQSVGLPARPSSMLTHVYDQLQQHSAPSEQHVTLCLAYILQRATQPWLDLLHQWIGVADSSRTDGNTDPSAQPWADLGITRTPLRPVDGEPRWEYAFAPRRMPMFITPDIRRTFFEAGRSLRALREASSGLHPLCWTDWPIRADWGWGVQEERAQPEYDLRFHARRVQREIDKWRASTTARLPRSRTMSISSMRSGARQSRPRGFSVLLSQPEMPVPAPIVPTDMWQTAAEPVPQAPVVDLHLDPKTVALVAPTPDDLEAFLAYHSDPAHPLLPHSSPSLEDYISRHLLVSPLAHATLISRALVSHYMDDLHFLDHLNVLHAFWLGGDAGFTERVSAALFGKDGDADQDEDVGAGRRARTRARLGIPTSKAESGSNPSLLQTPAPSVLETPSVNSLSTADAVPGECGIGLGVGLSNRRQWPPGGAELTYALRTTLFDHEMELLASRGPVWRGIEDRVSFALRALPDEGDDRREKWLDPQALEALDFLYLAYSPPTGIAPLLPPAIMDKYQVVHNVLLRLARVDAVLRGMYFDILRPDHVRRESSKRGVDAHHSRPGSRINQPTVLAAVLGVYPPASETAKSLRYMRFVMSWFVTAFSRYVLDTAGHNCETMNRRLASLQRGGFGVATAATSREPSRPATPSWMILEDDELELEMSFEDEVAGSDDSQAQLEAISQLQNAHSLVLYHHIILNRVLRACLLSPGSAGAFGTLSALLCLVLDLGKTVKDVAHQRVSADDGAAAIAATRERWAEQYTQFIKALERLARSCPERAASEEEEDSGDERDLQILLGDGRGAGRSTDLRELLLRLRLGAGSGIIARWEAEQRERDKGREREEPEPSSHAGAGGSLPRGSADLTAELLASEYHDAGDDGLRLAQLSPEPGEAPLEADPETLALVVDVPRTPPPAAVQVEVELAEDLAVVPPPIVHETERRVSRGGVPSPLRSLPPSPLKGTAMPPRLFQLQTGQPSPERQPSDDEISLD